MIGEWTEKVKIVSDNLKGTEVVTEEGEIVRLHKDAIGELAMEIVNYAEKLSGTDEKTLVSEEKRKFLEKLNNRNEFKQYIKNNYGSFFFNYYKEVLDMLKPQYLTRGLYLSCYLGYNGLLIADNPTRTIPLYEEDLQRILGLSRTETFRTKKELIDCGFLTINEDKTMMVNSKYCIKGELNKKSKTEKVRMFTDSIKEIYINSKPTEHKKLSLLFRLLPYVNLRWNVVCQNIEEEVRECIKPYTLKTLCEKLNQSHITKFKKDLTSITVGGKPVVIISTVMDKTKITINPKVYYKGTALDDLKYIEDDITSTLNGV